MRTDIRAMMHKKPSGDPRADLLEYKTFMWKLYKEYEDGTISPKEAIESLGDAIRYFPDIFRPGEYGYGTLI